jgi:hypothetical protein
MNIYISGPMSGMDNFNFPEFHRAAKRVREEGHNPINPAELPQLMFCDKTANYVPVPYSILLDTCLETIAIMADAILLLDGWENSNGACQELALAKKLGLQVMIFGIPHNFCEDSAV